MTSIIEEDLPGDKVVKNPLHLDPVRERPRVHLDLYAGDQQAEIDRLLRFCVIDRG